MSQLPAVDPDARAVILALRAAGASFSRIATMLNRLGVKGYQGGRWYGATVQRVIRGYANAIATDHHNTPRRQDRHLAFQQPASPDIVIK